MTTFQYLWNIALVASYVAGASVCCSALFNLIVQDFRLLREMKSYFRGGAFAALGAFACLHAARGVYNWGYNPAAEIYERQHYKFAWVLLIVALVIIVGCIWWAVRLVWLHFADEVTREENFIEAK